MAQLITLHNHKDPRGILYVLEKMLPFEIKRLYFITKVPVDVVRGGHKHKKTAQAAVCVSGSCKFIVDGTNGEEEILLSDPSQCLILEPQDWHEMKEFSADAVLLVMASEFYDKNDYIDSK